MQASANFWAWKYSTILSADRSEMNASETDIPYSVQVYVRKS